MTLLTSRYARLILLAAVVLCVLALIALQAFHPGLLAGIMPWKPTNQGVTDGANGIMPWHP